MLAARLGGALVTLWLSATLAFVLLRLLPGDAVTAQLVASGVGADVIAERRAALGLDAPPAAQYARYLVGLLAGDFGVSLASGQPVVDLLAAAFPHTLALALPAFVAGVAFGVALGTSAALVPGAWWARRLIDLALSLPIYWTATLALYGFTVLLGWREAVAFALPVGVLAFHAAGSIAQITRAAVLAARAADHVRTATAKGLPQPHIALLHIFRPAAAPVAAAAALQLGFLLGGTVVTETLFARPGVGRLLLDAVLAGDAPVVQGVVVLTALIYVGVSAGGDALAAWLDPRLRST